MRWFLAISLCLTVPGSVFAPEPQPRISSLFSVTIHATELDKANRFYGDILKFHLASFCPQKHAECLMVGPWQRIELSTENSTADNMVEAVAFTTNNARALRTYLLSRGVKPGGLSSDPCGAQEFFEVADPEQHNLVFVMNKWGVAGLPEISGRIIHAGFVVHDRAAEDKFYKDILGFHVYWHGGMKDGEDNWVDMQVPDGTDWIEYMLKEPENASHKTLGVMNHIALGVPDIHAAREQLIKNGWQGTEEPKIGRDGKWQLNLYDPDETRVELMEFKPTQDPCCAPYTGPHPHP